MTTEEKAQNYTFRQWLESYRQSTTRSAYNAAVGSFLHSIYQTDEKTEALAERYIAEILTGKREYTRDLGDYITYTQSGRARKDGKPMPPSSVKLYMAATYGFLAQFSEYRKTDCLPSSNLRSVCQESGFQG